MGTLRRASGNNLSAVADNEQARRGTSPSHLFWSVPKAVAGADPSAVGERCLERKGAGSDSDGELPRSGLGGTGRKGTKDNRGTFHYFIRWFAEVRRTEDCEEEDLY